MNFIENEYLDEYVKIIHKAKKREIKGYSEIHHIIPTKCGGCDVESNKVILSAEDHLRVHTLLPFFVEGEDKLSMLYAWNMMTHKGKLSDYSEYAILKEKHSSLHKEWCRKNRSGENSVMFGRTHSEESKTKISKAVVGAKNSMFGRIAVIDSYKMIQTSISKEEYYNNKDRYFTTRAKKYKMLKEQITSPI